MREWWCRLRATLAGRTGLESDLREEIDTHLEMEIQDKVAKGMSLEAARAAARQRFGNTTAIHERARDAWRLRSLETVLQDLRYAARMLRRSPGFTAAAVLSLALGMGANTAIFSVADALLLRNLAVRNPEQLVMLWTRDESPLRPDFTFTHPMFVKFSSLARSFSAVSAVWLIDRPNVNDEHARIGLVSGNYFSTLGVDAAIGRTITPDDDRAPGGHPVAVISHAYWERRFALDFGVLGRTLMLNGVAFTILGVTPRGFRGEWVGKPADVWIPFAMQAQVMPEIPGLQGFPTRVVARLAPGVTIRQAQSESQVVYRQILREEAGGNATPQRIQRLAKWHVELEPGARGYSPQRESLAPSLAILMVIAGLVLLIACANIANLLLARSAARQREMAVRLAIGAGSGRLVRQLLTESLLLSTIGGALGVLLAVWLTRALPATVFAGPASMTGRQTPWGISLDLHPDIRWVAFTAALCLLTGLLFGLAPAFRSSKAPLSPALIGRGVDARGSGVRFNLGKALVIAQVALSLLLLIGAGLLVRTLQNLKELDLGVDRRHLLLVWTSPGQTGRLNQSLAVFWRTVCDRISALPGVLSASASNQGLLDGGEGGGPSETTVVEGQPPKPGLFLLRAAIAPRFFETAGVPLLAGRDFTEADTETTPQVAIVNQTMARFFFGDQNPVGKRFRLGGNAAPPWEIVGVVKDIKQGTPRESRGLYYCPYRQLIGQARVMCLVVRTAGTPGGMAARLRQELREIDPGLPIVKIDTVDEQLDDVLVRERLVTGLASIFGALAVVLACLGLYGLMSYTAARRTNEIGIRLALGASRRDVLTMVLKESLWMVGVGIAIGIPAALAATRLVSAMLFGVKATDPFTIGAASLLMVAVSVLASFLPARRAATVDPMVALRYE